MLPLRKALKERQDLNGFKSDRFAPTFIQRGGFFQFWMGYFTIFLGFNLLRTPLAKFFSFSFLGNVWLYSEPSRHLEILLFTKLIFVQDHRCPIGHPVQLPMVTNQTSIVFFHILLKLVIILVFFLSISQRHKFVSKKKISPLDKYSKNKKKININFYIFLNLIFCFVEALGYEFLYLRFGFFFETWRSHFLDLLPRFYRFFSTRRLIFQRGFEFHVILIWFLVDFW